MKIGAIILAGGASTRLGQPKQLVRISETTLLSRTIEEVLDAGFADIFLVLGSRQKEIEDAVDLSRVVPVANPQWETGIASSIRAGIVELERSNPAFRGALLCVCDQPRLSSEHLIQLKRSFYDQRGKATIASKYAEVAGVPVIFPAKYFPALMRLRGDEGARKLLHNPLCQLSTVEWPAGAIDIDTPQDLLGL